MSRAKLLASFLAFLSVIFISGCADDLRIQNERQRKEIADLAGKMQANKLSLEQTEQKLTDADKNCKVKTDALQQMIDAMDKDLKQKKGLLDSMGKQLIYGTPLPAELSTLLEDFAKGSPDLVTFDASRGVLKFKSDLLFDKGSDEVSSSASAAVKTLTSILNSESGKKFDIIIAGHTDDMPIARPETRAKHPTNWHLSVHRAISVLHIMSEDGLSPERMSVRGFGEYRPLEPNAAGKRGNAQNRRVEIYIVPQGA